MSDGSDSLQNGQKCDIMRVLRTNYVMFFAQNLIFLLKWFANMEVIFYEKLSFFRDPLVVPLGLLCGKRLKIDVCVCVCASGEFGSFRNNIWVRNMIFAVRSFR